jgi:hypothetical protein
MATDFEKLSAGFPPFISKRPRGSPIPSTRPARTRDNDLAASNNANLIEDDPPLTVRMKLPRACPDADFGIVAFKPIFSGSMLYASQWTVKPISRVSLLAKHAKPSSCSIG